MYLAASILWTPGCVQDSPPVSFDQSISVVLELLGDQEPEVRRTAAEALGKIGNPAVAESLLPLVSDPDARVREAVVKALGRLGPAARPLPIEALRAALEDPVESVRRAAAIGLGELEPDRGSLEALPTLLRSTDSRLRKAAVQAMLQVDAAAWVSDLCGALNDEDPEIRQGAAAALGEWGGPEALSWLRAKLAEDPSPAVRAEAAFRLGMSDHPEAKRALESAAVKDQDAGVRRWAMRQLNSSASSDSTP